ncbi:MAG: AraC family transcriptional regulator [Candidatus Pseudobacter hemicellulosilyticus]|uniref:AraC family transcriptional regulator n=1 Tax=Candidatus Pseudobacter hemicellulosilyticus TaxID=3121375 RepID=A0AAJ6BHU3_9BACT|nr:MAG: AraC family transcriptional regulator [Pseudobacter sp.]
MKSMEMQLSLPMSAEVEKIENAARLIEKDVKCHHSIAALSRKVLMNKSQLKSRFRELYGVGPYTYLQQQRLERSKMLLLAGESVQCVALTVGFCGKQSATNFVRFFKRKMRLSPDAWRKLQGNCPQNG